MNFSRKLTLIGLTVGIIALAFFPATLINAEQSSGVLPNPLGEGTTLESVIGGIIDWIIKIGMLVAVVMICWNALQMVMHSGEDAALSKARTGLYWSFAGLAVMLFGRGWISVIQSLVGMPATGPTADTLYQKLADIAAYAYWLIFAVAIVMTAWGAVDLAKGDEKSISAGRQKVIWGIIGIVVIAGVMSITKIIGDYFGFTVPTL